MSPASTKFKTSVSLLFVLNLTVWLVAGSKLENPDWNMWIDKDDGHLSNKRITAKSVFIAPQISKCSEGYRLDQLGKCVKITTVNHANQWQFYLDKLNLMFAKKPESNAVVAGSEPFKVNIPLFNSPQEDKNKKNSSTARPVATDAPTSQKIENTTRKQPHFTDLFNMQTTLTTNGKTELPFTIADATMESTTKTDAWTSTKWMPDSTTEVREKHETTMWITEKPKKTQSDKGVNKFQTNAPYLPTTFELSNPTTDGDRQTSTVFTTQTSPFLEKLGTTLESFSTLDTAETVYPSSLPSPTPLENTKTTYIPTTNSERFSETTLKPARPTTASDKQSTLLSSSTTTTTDAPFLIIVTDTNNHIVNTNENEPSVETDYILISNSSSSLLNVNKPVESVEDVSHTKKASEIKIVDKMCIDSELCNDEIVLPYFESTKTTRNDSPSAVSNSWNKFNSGEVSTSSENVQKQKETSKIISVLHNVKYEESSSSQQPSANAPPDSVSFVQTSSLATDKLSSDHSHIYESLKMPPSLPSKVEPNVKSDVKKKSDPSTVQTLVNIVHPTSAYSSSTSVYSPTRKSSPATTLKPYIPNKKAAPSPTTQKSPTLTTTKRIFTQPKPITSEPNVYNLMYSMQPANADYNSNSNEFLFGSSSSYIEPQFGSYDSSSYVRFPSDQQTQYKHPNSKFSLDFANTFGADTTSDAHQQGSNSFIRFPTISRTPASTFNSNQQWPNTRWPPHQTVQSESSWNSRWPPHQQQPQQQYYSQNSRYQQNVPLTNYKLLQL